MRALGYTALLGRSFRDCATRAVSLRLRDMRPVVPTADTARILAKLECAKVIGRDSSRPGNTTIATDETANSEARQMSAEYPRHIL